MSGPGTPSETPGHRALTEQEHDLVVAVRILAEACRRTLEILGESGVCDQRWMAIAKTHLQEGTMAAVRSITKPDFF